jgi:DNA-binding SARP family transcriptional activator
MFRLQVFGGLSLLDAAGSPAVTQRQRLALLAVLAIAGERGVSRDRLLLHFWPDSTADHARHALEQLLYALRRQLSAEAITGPDPLRLNPAVITSDLDDFGRSLARGALAEAVALYGGPFLDGFYLETGGTFEDWVSGERRRLADDHAMALYRLARQAGDGKQITQAIGWWQKLAAADPLSERAALGLAAELETAGNWAGALEHAQAFEALVRRELGVAPTPELSAFIRRLRDQHARGAEPAPAAKPLPDAPDRYPIEREIGHGLMSVVYLAKDRKHNRPVALKLLRPELVVSTEHERFLREIEFAARLHHPHILPLYDSGLQESPGRAARPYYVMPYIEGDTLRDRMAREGQLPVPVAIGIARQVADALGCAHRSGIVHRDIKPENLLLEGDHAWVVDFGIAHALNMASGERLTLTGVQLGTPLYMSPEQAAAHAAIDARSDIYSLGCVLYEMLAGEPPYTGVTPQAILARHVAAPVPRVRIVRPEVPPAIEAAIVRALAKAPAERFGTAEEFGGALGPQE